MQENGSFRIIKKTLISFGLIGIISLMGIIGCGSDDDPGSDSQWVKGVFEPSVTFEALCEHPRSGIDPTSGASYPDIQGTLLDEMNWQRSWSNDVYLWYDEIVDRNPAGFNDKFKYFDTLRTDNCGTTYFTINFTGENAKGFGKYADGFSPADTGGTGDTSLPGCSVTDDFDHALGDRQEALLATALFYRENDRCPEQGELPQTVLQGIAGQSAQREGYMDIPLPLQNAIIN